ncbi:adenylate/guanylate cyclase domain-containing protein [Salipiger mucosus]|uniref:Adenylate cyclase n=1 Tax=Salipiger mucosus DSM 16094 TaxID=1123237 RepID=S9QRF2_9RHOB|nr:adenylate/guanylate cyclase domain-containing protein [Salipiger mucosus]EPX83976.1 Adenylate cyclase [Salipiger mucosus DSM 16094]
MKRPKAVRKESRKLSIIFAADVAGYSRLMANDEDRTLALLERSRRYIDKTIAEHRGRIANTAGDSVIAVFESATEALTCSLKIQQKLTKENEKLSPDKRLMFRVGLHMGEIYTRGSDVLGSGVNLAARLEGYTDPGAICMSEIFLSIVDKSVSGLPIADLGHVQLKNIDTPVRAFEMLSERAERGGIEFRNQTRMTAQKRKVFVLAASLGVVVVSALVAVSLAISLATVNEMAEKNKPPRYRIEDNLTRE